MTAWPQSLRTGVSIVLQSTFGMYIAWGADYTQIYNDAYRPILGSTKHPALGLSARATFGESWHIIGPMFARVMRGETIGADDWMLPLDRHGYLEECFFVFSYSPIRDESGGVGGVLVTVFESSARVLGERRLRTLRDLATGTADARSPAEVWAGAARALAANPADVPFALLYAMDGDAREARLVGQTGLADGHPAAPRTVALDVAPGPSDWPLAAAARAPERVSDLGRRFGALPGGTWPAAPTTAVALPVTRPGQATPYGVLVLGVSAGHALDATCREFQVMLAEQLASALANAHSHVEERRRAEALAALDRDKTAFFSNVSHEFRTPLTLLLGPTEEALASPERALSGPALETVHRNGLRLLKLVNALLDFARLEAGRVQAAFEVLDLAGLTRDLVSAFRASVEHAGLELTFACPEPLPEVLVDPDMWEKIVLNLMSNAFKFTFAGAIAVTLRPTAAGGVELSVADSGTGIPEAELPHVFERFRRVEGARARSHEGSGIGLALVHELVRMHGGKMGVASVVERGSVFTVELPPGRGAASAGTPAAAPDARAAAAPYVVEASQWSRVPPSPEAASTQGHGAESSRRSGCVLIADDNADMRDYLARLVSRSHGVIAVADGAHALEAIARRMPDVVLSDVMMPDVDGFELMRRLRADPRTRALRVVLLSAQADEGARVAALEAGADDYLVKPFAARELLARVQTQVDLAQAHAEARRARERLHAQLMQAPVALSVVSGPDMIVTLANPRYEAMVGRRDCVGRPFRALFAELPDDAPVFLMLERIYRTGQTFSADEYRVPLDRRGDGAIEDVYFRFTCQPIFAADGAIEGVMTVAVDVTEHVVARQAVEHLAREQQRLAAITESSSDFIAHATLDGRVLYLNDAGRRLVGLDGADVTRTVASDFFSPEDAAFVSSTVIPQALAHERWQGELAFRHFRTGQRIPVAVNAFVTRDPESGEPFGLATVTRDLTAEKAALAERERLLDSERRAHAEAEAQRERLRRVLMQAPAMVALLRGRDHVFELANPRYQRAVGGRALIGRPVRDALAGLVDPAFFGLLDDVFATGERVHRSEVPVVLPDDDGGATTFHNVTYEPMLGVDGRPEGVMTVAHDVTELVRSRRKSEALADELRQGEALFRASQDASPIAFSYHRILRGPADAVVDLELVYQNQAAARVNRLPAGRAGAGLRMLETFPALATSELWLTYRSVAESGTTAEIESYYGGEHFDAWFRVIVVRPTADSLVLMFEDVTSRRMADLERERLIRALERSNQDLDRFAFVASHDLKAPLRGVANTALWIEQDLGPLLTGETRTLMDLMRGRIQRLEALIDGVLTYSRAGRAVAPEQVDVGLLLAEVIELLAPPPGAHIVIGPGMPVIETERVPLQQVFLNLIGNAIKHARRSDPHVHISVREAGAGWEFAVSDNGPGIAPRFHERVWAIFQTLESRDKVEGTGIGLSVVQKIVESREGRVWLESNEGEGATFRFTWSREAPPRLRA
ncbi:MAG: ATP-binding protein [Myxococcota bacterium]